MGLARLVHTMRAKETSMAWFALKSIVPVGVLYYTVEQGLWSKSEDSIKFYGKIYNNIAPYVKENIPKEVINEIPKLPSISVITNCAKYTWNKGVITTMKFITEIPTHTSNGINTVLELPAVKDTISNLKTNVAPSSKTS